MAAVPRLVHPFTWPGHHPRQKLDKLCGLHGGRGHQGSDVPSELLCDEYPLLQRQSTGTEFGSLPFSKITLVQQQYEEMARNPTHARLGSPWMLDMVNYANEVKESFRQIVERSIPPQSRMPTPRPVHVHQPVPPSPNMNMHAHPGPWDSQNCPPAQVPIVQPSNRQW